MAGGGGYGGVEVPGSRHRPPSSSATRHDEKMSRANGEASTKATPEDFRVEKVISKGSFGTVYLALLQSKPFAMKVVDLHDMNRYVIACVRTQKWTVQRIHIEMVMTRPVRAKILI